MKKILSIIMILCFCTVSFTGCSTNNSGKGTNADAMSLLENSSQYYLNSNNFKLEHELKSCLIYNSSETGAPLFMTTCTNVDTMVYTSPFSFANDITLSFDEDADDGTLNLLLQRNGTSQQYGLRNGDYITVYQSIDMEWQNAELNNDDFLNNDSLGINYILNYKTYITDGFITNDNDKLEGVDAIKAEYNLNESYLRTLFLKSGFEQFALMMNSSNSNKAISDLMKGVKLTVWFDKNSAAVLQTQIDMTQIMPTISQLVLDDNKDKLTNEQRETLTKYTDAIKLVNTVKYGKINNDIEFELPEEAKKSENQK